MSFEDKVVIVTGASSGIGAAAAKIFASEGAILSLVDINEEQLKQVGDEISRIGKKPVLITANVAKDDDSKRIIETTIDAYGKINVLVNNAGILRFGNILSGNSVQTFDELMSVNLRSVILLTHYAAPHLVKTRGNIVNVSSAAGSRTPPMSFLVPYSVSKIGVDHFTKGAALELAEHGVRVNAVSPGPVRTDIMKSTGRAGTRQSSGAPPLGKIAEPEELGGIIVFLASDKANSITGSIYVCDNGIKSNQIKIIFIQIDFYKLF